MCSPAQEQPSISGVKSTEFVAMKEKRSCRIRVKERGIMASLLRGGEQTLRHTLLGFALGASVAGGVAVETKMKIWRKTAEAAERRICPPEGPETMKQVDGVLDKRQRQFLAREWNKVQIK